jgi:hypothetical protein
MHRSLRPLIPSFIAAGNRCLSRHSGFLPAFFQLEARTLLSTVSWINPIGGDWDTPSNWSTDALPGPSDDVVINVPGITVTHNAGGDSVNSIISADSIALNGGSLSIAATSTISSDLAVGGTLGGSGNLTVTGTLTTGPHCTLLGSAGSSLTANNMAFGPGVWTLDGRALTTTGAVTWASGQAGDGVPAGVILADSATFTNQGTFIDAPPPSAPAHFFGVQNLSDGGSGSGVFINQGSYVLEGPGNFLSEFRVPFTNSGTVQVQAGTLNLDVGAPSQSTDAAGPGTITGTFAGAPGTTMNLGYEDLAATASVSGDAVSISGQIRCPFHANATTAVGSFTSPNVSVGDLNVAGGVLDFSPTTGPQSLPTGNLSFSQGSTLQGSDNFVVSGTLTTDYHCTVLGSAGSSLTANNVTFGRGPWTLDGRAMTTTGTVTWATGQGGDGVPAAVLMADGATFTNQGTFIDQPPSSFPDHVFGARNLNATGTGSGAFINQGSYVLEGPGNFLSEFRVPFTNSGTVQVQAGTLNLTTVGTYGSVTIASGASLGVSTYTQTSGSTVLNGGTINGGTLGINDGALSGTGTIYGNVSNGGQVIPDGTGAAGLLTINGNYTQTPTGSMNIELGGTAAGASDLLAVSGTASLGGTLNIATLGSFAPAFGNVFQVMTFGASAGNFSGYTGTSLAIGLFLDPVFNTSNLTLAVDRVAISGAPPFPLQGNPINLTAIVTGPSAGNSFTFSWNVTQNGNPFGSGSGAACTFTPNLNATYLVTLTVTDVIGGKGIVTQSIVVAPSIFVLNPTASGALTLSGNASIDIPGEVVVDSSSATALTASGNAQLKATVVDVCGGFQKTGNATISPAPTTGVSINDPLGSLGGPSASGTPAPVNFNKGTQSISQGVYSQIRVSGNASLTLGPGIYVIEGGGITVTGNASISGQNVFIYNAGSNYPLNGGDFGGITLSGNGTFNLSAPTSGTYAGILIFHSRQNTRALSLSGNAMAGISGLIYAPNALLSMSGNAALTSALDVGTLNLSGNVALTQTATGGDGSGDTSGIANTLLAGNLTVYINDPTGLFTADELARIQDAVNAWDAILAPYNVTVAEVNDPTLANIVIDTRSASACGDAASGVLGCYNAPNGEITLIQGWNWYAGSDASKIGASQYDFETTVLHELGHALGLGGSTNPSSPMYETLASGAALRTVTTQDLNIPDPPAGADPQMAAGFAGGVVTGRSAAGAGVVASNSANNASPAGIVPVVAPRMAFIGSEGPMADFLKGQPAVSATAHVVQVRMPDRESESPWTGIQAGLVLDAALAGLAEDGARVRRLEKDATNDVLTVPAGVGVEDGIDATRARSHLTDPCGFDGAASWPLSVRLGPRSGVMPAQLAADAVMSTGRLAAPPDSVVVPAFTRGQGEGLAVLAATMFMAGSWCDRVRFRGISTRWAARLRKRLRLK